MLAALVPAMFVIAQPDLGSGLVYMVIAVTLLFVAGTSWKQLAALFALGAVALTFVLVAAPAVGVHVLKPYQVQRLTAFLHPTTNAQKEGYQQEESKIAIGSGQKTGRGINSYAESNSATCPRITPISSSPPSASSTGSSAPRSCCRCTRC